MASPNIYPGGLNLAGTVFANGPATLQLTGTTYLSGSVQWLDTISGSNANAGNKPELPVQTLAQAVTNSAANGVIVIGAGSSESLSGSQSIALAGLSIFGCGTGSSRPRYTCTGAVNMWAISANGVWVENIYFPAPTVAPTSRVSMAGTNGTMKDCYFECGSNVDSSGALNVSNNSCRVEGTSFVVTASRPNIGLLIGGDIADFVLYNNTFDGGSYGWGDYAFKTATTVPTRLKALGNTFINRSDYAHNTTGTTYQIIGINMGGTGNVLLTA